eukprot:gene23341-29553_t
MSAPPGGPPRGPPPRGPPRADECAGLEEAEELPEARHLAGHPHRLDHPVHPREARHLEALRGHHLEDLLQAQLPEERHPEVRREVLLAARLALRLLEAPHLADLQADRHEDHPEDPREARPERLEDQMADRQE